MRPSISYLMNFQRFHWLLIYKTLFFFFWLACFFSRDPRHNAISLFSALSLQSVHCLHRFSYRVVLHFFYIIQSRSCILTDILSSPHLCFLSQFLCTVVAILLHYFFMSAFAWMFVEALHIYRMQTEARNINYGAMRFYYAIGWGVPAIITGRYIYTCIKNKTNKLAILGLSVHHLYSRTDLVI